MVIILLNTVKIIIFIGYKYHKSFNGNMSAQNCRFLINKCCVSRTSVGLCAHIRQLDTSHHVIYVTDVVVSANKYVAYYMFRTFWFIINLPTTSFC
jgi:hypothetical protein